MSRQSQQEKENQNLFAAATLLTFLFLPPSLFLAERFWHEWSRKTEDGRKRRRKRKDFPLRSKPVFVVDALCCSAFRPPPPLSKRFRCNDFRRRWWRGPKERNHLPRDDHGSNPRPTDCQRPNATVSRPEIVPGSPDSSFLSRCSSACLHCVVRRSLRRRIKA